MDLGVTWRLVLWNVLTWVLMLGTIAVGITAFIALLLFIGEHAYSMGCTIC